VTSIFFEFSYGSGPVISLDSRGMISGNRELVYNRETYFMMLHYDSDCRTAAIQVHVSSCPTKTTPSIYKRNWSII